MMGSVGSQGTREGPKWSAEMRNPAMVIHMHTHR